MEAPRHNDLVGATGGMHICKTITHNFEQQRKTTADLDGGLSQVHHVAAAGWHLDAQFTAVEVVVSGSVWQGGGGSGSVSGNGMPVTELVKEGEEVGGEPATPRHDRSSVGNISRSTSTAAAPEFAPRPSHRSRNH